MNDAWVRGRQLLMNRSKIATLWLVGFAAVLSLFVWQVGTIRRLRAENSRTRELQAMLQAAAEAPSHLSANQMEAEERERLALEHTELLRLRAEVARLRAQLAANMAARTASLSQSDPISEPERSAEPVQTFVANADATLAAGQALVFGGWPTPPGKHTLVLVQPSILELTAAGRIGSVLLEGKFVEVPDDLVTDLGMEKLKAGGRATSVQSLIGPEEMKTLLKILEETPGVDLLSAPRIQTGDGIQAKLSVTEQKTIAGQEHVLGPSLDVEPRIAADGSSVILTVSARLKKATTPP